MKRGEANSNAELWLLIAAILMAGFLGQNMLKDVADRVDGRELEKNFIARDLAITLETVYAAPGDISYTYWLGQYKYLVDITNAKVAVRDKDDKIPATYRIIGISRKDSVYESSENQKGEKVQLTNYKMTRFASDCPYNSALILQKKFRADGSSIISVEGKNVGICKEGDNSCEGRGVICEQ